MENPLTEAAVLDLFRASGALLEGHFRLTSGLHSPYYLQCARLLMDPRRAERVCASLKARIERAEPPLAFDRIVSPALGGVVFGYELARQFGVVSMFVERDAAGQFALRRGFALGPEDRVLVAEDVVTTGLSTRECIACVRGQGAQVVGAVCLVDRSGGKADLGVPLVPLLSLELPVYPPDRLPPELAAVPAVKPGSRPASGL